MDTKKALPFGRSLIVVFGAFLVLAFLSIFSFHDVNRSFFTLFVHLRMAVLVTAGAIILNRLLTGKWGDLYRTVLMMFLASGFIFSLHALNRNYYSFNLQPGHYIFLGLIAVFNAFSGSLIRISSAEQKPTVFYPLPHPVHLLVWGLFLCFVTIQNQGNPVSIMLITLLLPLIAAAGICVFQVKARKGDAFKFIPFNFEVLAILNLLICLIWFPTFELRYKPTWQFFVFNAITVALLIFFVCDLFKSFATRQPKISESATIKPLVKKKLSTWALFTSLGMILLSVFLSLLLKHEIDSSARIFGYLVVIIIIVSLFTLVLSVLVSVVHRIFSGRLPPFKFNLTYFNIVGMIICLCIFIMDKAGMTSWLPVMILIIISIGPLIAYKPLLDKFLPSEKKEPENVEELPRKGQQQVKTRKEPEEILKKVIVGIDEGARKFISKILPDVWKNIKKAFGSIMSKIPSYGKALIRPKVFIPVISAIVLIVFLLLVNAFLCTHVTSMTPKGQVGSHIMIKAVFSDDINIPASDIVTATNTDLTSTNAAVSNELLMIKPGVEYFKITPKLEGTYRIEKHRSVIFLPEQEIMPSSSYRVSVKPSHFKSRKPFILGKSVRFRTARFEVGTTSLFFVYDILYGLEKAMVAEINFNFPVDPYVLKEHLTLQIDDQTLPYQLEPSTVPTRFYLRSGALARRESESKILLKIDGKLHCINGKVPLKKDYSKVLALPQKEIKHFGVQRVETFPVAGTTYLAIKFNMPARAQAIREYTSITYKTNIGLDTEKEISVPFGVDTEYCYAVLKADFLPNRNYKVRISRGLPAMNGLVLEDEREETVTLKDMQPEVNFTSSGSIIPLNGRMMLEMYTVNLDKFNIKTEKIFRNNLVYHLQNRSDSSYTKLWSFKTVNVEDGKLNERVQQYIDLHAAYNASYKGFFRIRIEDTKDPWRNATKYILCTDLGIFAKHSGSDLIVRVYSINNLTPVAGVSVKLLSTDNQTIQEMITGADGTVTLTDWTKNKNDFRPFLITAEKNDDYSYLDINEDAVNQSRFSTEGTSDDPDDMKAFMTTERGVYRPGEKVVLVSMVRKGSKLELPPPITVKLQIYDPSGSLFATIEKQVPQDGTLGYEISVPSYARTGEYSVSMTAGENLTIGRAGFKVEEFIPDKIKASIEAPDKTLVPGGKVDFKVKAVQLYGPPASGCRVRTIVNLVSRQFSHPSWSKYQFGDDQAEYSGDKFNLGESHLDDRGEKEYSIDIPSTVRPPSALSARIYAEVYDEGGRIVSALKDVPIDPYPVYVGLKLDEKEIYFKGEPVHFSWTSIDPQGHPKKLENARIFIKHKIFYTILRKYGVDRYGYESDDYMEVVLDTKLDMFGKGDSSFIPPGAGEYTIFVGDEEGMHTIRRINVQGAGYEATDVSKANNLVIRFNKDSYNIGETALVTILSPIPGRLFLNVEREKVMSSQIVDLVDNKAEIMIPITADFTPNVYISGYVIRKPDETLKLLPMASLGIKNMEIAAGDKRIAINFNCPKETRSMNGLDVQLSLSSISPWCRAVLFAVDEGILQITQFETPKPYEFFYSKRSLRTRLYSIFEAVLPDVTPLKMAVGGDEAEYDLSRRHLNPVQAKRVKSIALYSGILQPDVNGILNYHFNIPEFNGRLRVMALAADQVRFGSASTYVTVADPIVLNSSLPRVLAPGDLFDIPVRVFNKTGKAGDINVGINISGPVRIIGPASQKLTLGNESESRIVFRAEALSNAGKAVFTFTGTGNGELVTSTVELPVRPVQSLTTITKHGKLKPGAKTDLPVPAGFIPFGQRTTLVLSPLYLCEFLSSLDYLIQYPYGCIEQTCSAVFPLLYLKQLDLVNVAYRERGHRIDYFLSEGLRKIESMVLPDGNFSYWPGMTYSNPYCSLYATELLLEANRMGYAVNPAVLQKVKSSIGLRTIVNKGRLDRRDDDNSGQQHNQSMYILYLQALAGEPDKAALDQARMIKLKDLDTSDRCYLALALSFIGDSSNARKVMPNEFNMRYFPREMGGGFDSYARRLALYLSTLCEVSPQDPRRLKLAEELITYAPDGRFGTTQECVFALRALYKTYKDQAEEVVKVDLMKNGALAKSFNEVTGVYSDNSMAGQTLTIQNNGEKPVYYNLSEEGTMLKKDPIAVSKKIGIRHEYYDSKGNRINLGNIVQGEIIVVKVILDTAERNVENLVIVDLFPAGLEIENPRLQSRGQLDFEPEFNWNSAYEDFRDDRILLFTGSVQGRMVYSYTLRAVTAGTFEIPQVTAEAMYDPDVKARDEDQGKLNVVAAP